MAGTVEGGTAGVREAKQALRKRVEQARRERDRDERRAEDEARAAHLASLLAPYRSVALYASKDPEPDVMVLLDRLDARVLLPVIGRLPDGTPRRQPDWAWWEGAGAMREGIWGIHEPTTPPLGAEGLAEVDAIVCSGVAADRAGFRCGVGGGWYDRALSFRRPGVPVVIALNAREILDAVPREGWDARVDAVATGDGITLTSDLLRHA